MGDGGVGVDRTLDNAWPLQLSLHLYNPLHLPRPSTSPLQRLYNSTTSTTLYNPLQLYSYTSSTLYNPLQHPSGIDPTVAPDDGRGLWTGEAAVDDYLIHTLF